MSNNKYQEPVCIIVVSPAWPIDMSGSGLATLSMLKQLLFVSNNIIFIGMTDEKFNEPEEWQNSPVKFVHIPIKRYSKWLRFITSLISPLPAITMQFAVDITARQRLYKVIENANFPRKVVIFEDTLPASLSFGMKKKFPDLKYAVRSENVLSKVFERLAKEGNFLSRVSWGIEVAKNHHLEVNLLKNADRYWTISLDDFEEYNRRYSICPDGVIGVSLDPAPYAEIPSGSATTLLYLGSADFRKSRGLSQFIETSWHEVRHRIPSAEFHLAGRNTQKFNQPELSIRGEGFYDDQRQFLSRGLIFVNPQEDGSGVKLKSIVAMLAGKALVSTEIGVEGVEGIPNEHFLVARRAQDLGKLIINLMNNPAEAIAMGQRAQQYICKVYSEENLEKTVQPLLRELLYSSN